MMLEGVIYVVSAGMTCRMEAATARDMLGGNGNPAKRGKWGIVERMAAQEKDRVFLVFHYLPGEHFDLIKAYRGAEQVSPLKLDVNDIIENFPMKRLSAEDAAAYLNDYQNYFSAERG